MERAIPSSSRSPPPPPPMYFSAPPTHLAAEQEHMHGSMSRESSTSRAPRQQSPSPPPPPPPYEVEDTDYKPVNWKKIFLSPKYIPWHILGIAIIVATVWVTLEHDEIVEKLRPFSEKVRDVPAGWLIPIVILIVLSFPPLFGHEIVAVLCGVVYGLWIGFGVVAAGTFFGEVATWFAFKYALRRKAAKMERTNLNYGALARLTRDGGFWVVLVIRVSVIPSHFSTAVFSCCNVKFWHFCVATFLALPKQLILVYVGVLLTQDGKDGKLEQNIMFGVAFVVTIILGAWIWWKMRAIKKVLIQEQAERRRQRGMEMDDLAKKERYGEADALV